MPASTRTVTDDSKHAKRRDTMRDVTSKPQQTHAFRCSDRDWEFLGCAAEEFTREAAKVLGSAAVEYTRSDVLRILIAAAREGRVTFTERPRDDA